MKRRKVGNLLALAVLAAVVQRPMHPYEMASTLRGWGKDQDMEIKWGSLYTVVRNMDKHGLIAAVESTREGRRPERTVYRITDVGRAELLDWTRELISTPVREYPRFKAGLSVMVVLGPDEVINLFTTRLRGLEEQIARMNAELTEHRATVPRLLLIETEYDLAIHEAEAAWTQSMLDEFTSGTYPGLAQWRSFHETGEIPAELAELAERHLQQEDRSGRVTSQDGSRTQPDRQGSERE